MSGGSHNYLHTKSVEDLMFCGSDLAWMVEDLSKFENGGSLAVDTDRLIDELAVLASQIEAIDQRIGNLRKAWKTVEWCVSGDTTRETTDERLRALTPKEDRI